MATAVLRKSVPLRPAEVEILNRVRSSDSPERRALHEILGVEDVHTSISEAEGLRAILQAGIESIEERVVQNGYAAMASEYNDEDRAFAAAARARSVEIASRP